MNASNKVFLDDAAMMATLDAMGGTAPVAAKFAVKHIPSGEICEDGDGYELTYETAAQAQAAITGPYAANYVVVSLDAPELAPVVVSDDEHRAKIDAIRAKHVAAMKAYQDMHEAVMAQLDAMQVATEAHFAAKRVAA